MFQTLKAGEFNKFMRHAWHAGGWFYDSSLATQRSQNKTLLVGGVVPHPFEKDARLLHWGNHGFSPQSLRVKVFFLRKKSESTTPSNFWWGHEVVSSLKLLYTQKKTSCLAITGAPPHTTPGLTLSHSPETELTRLHNQIELLAVFETGEDFDDVPKSQGGPPPELPTPSELPLAFWRFFC